MIKLFDKISDKEKNMLLKEFEASTISYKKNQRVLSSVKSNVIGIVLEGFIQIIKTDYDGNSSIVEEVLEENIFGTMINSLNNNEYSIIAKEDSKILIIEYDMIYSSNNFKPYITKFLKNLLNITTEIIEEKNKHIQILTKKSIRDKILEYINVFRIPGSKVIYLPFSYTEFASYLAVDRCAMSRELKNLRDDGIIETKGKKIYLKF